MRPLYLDSCSIIYVTEAVFPFHDAFAARILKHRADPDASLMTSRLSRLECRMKPMREGNLNLLREYDEFFVMERLKVVELSAAVVEKATEIRAKYGFKTPDALHLATAIVHQAEAFLTGDSKLEKCTEITVETPAGS